MLELFLAFKQHLVWALILWVLLFTAFAALFARGQLIAFAGGLLRVLGSIFVSPFVFLRKATAEVTTRRGESESNQYLLNRALLLAQAILIIAAIGAFASTAVIGWNTLVPTAETRNAAKEHRPKLEEQRMTATTRANEVTRLDEEWRTKEPVVVGAARKEHQDRIDAAKKRMTAIESDLGTYDNPAVALNTLDSIKTIATSVERNEWASRQLHPPIYNNFYSLSDWQRQLLGQWIDQWQLMINAENALALVSGEQLRAETQPNYADAVREREYAQARVTDMESYQRELDEAASLKWKAAAWRMLAAFVAILIFLWVSGLAIELAWLGVRVADDIRRIREVREEPQDAEAAAQEEIAPRLPIRRPSNEPITVSEALP